ncbi:hypothetical protein CANTEDRAFT_116924 [Yamadazyma tenuis ATCC 10573]|uniref:Uncharacterized protein n=1 Tax=Candida tenuis (strain ATCC 10573 / BCRC 21748 / CBS 615 / JCM 9827 / NBRC 10315 / NRRL Y-1498 / VKM Y-70) TaxID=590646 RepID=G3BCS3_CANTC|nr:uncharacterized protein CANTEDRAFT_116924 [Yamadazyma tenuis ATCC 10573]XP_006690085.1 uncharacterized protein CANTEDRAFT_116924 [Yamadazyma tenuis ATCC 10573]EGV60870.1 hypothetical protein CANTEDRAFT_116924 [Yamadazyma tenuis ATCC 10573]EGV60871.1 hypothetical protein CANTEDRAFT_116924 [Yamadazyma tenuis ATCC 10573]
MITPKTAYRMLYYSLPFYMLTTTESVMLHMVLVLFAGLLSYSFYNAAQVASKLIAANL